MGKREPYDRTRGPGPEEHHADASISALFSHKDCQPFQEPVEEGSSSRYALAGVFLMRHIMPHITHVVASVRSSVLVVVAQVAQRWVLQALPQSVDDESCQLLPSLRLAGERSRNGNHFFHLCANVSNLFPRSVLCKTHSHVPVIDRLSSRFGHLE